MTVTPAKVNWFKLHPKAQTLAVAVAALVLASIPGVLNDAVTLQEAMIADVTAIIGLFLVYMSPPK